ncbi:MAG TPA: ADP-polyphosphate phosphotransferase [Terriglobia bacterium]|nr:ADP-polyphosphate phosphotransferase [Terriglobia bacterium]
MKIDPKDFRVKEGKRFNLRKWPTLVDPFYNSQKEYKKMLADYVGQLSSLQQVHYADNRYALLLIFQAMDAAGKDGVIRHIMSGVNPQGCQVYSFKHPSATELDHDFMWRTTNCLPARGMIGVFNRSYYEEVLIVRVHPEILRSQSVPHSALNDETIWKHRYESIVEFEKHLYRNGTQVVKFFLHISKEEQRRRFVQRIDDPDKNWKFNESDLKEREFWKEYMDAYEKCLSETSTRNAPWYVVPGDDKENARLIVSEIVLSTLRALNPKFPEPTAERLLELQAFRKHLMRKGG